ncbi:hypothetical protein NUACC26_029830 [Scytonema sp. NUACC26]
MHIEISNDIVDVTRSLVFYKLPLELLESIVECPEGRGKKPEKT